jgi:hypothetical protein
MMTFFDDQNREVAEAEVRQRMRQVARDAHGADIDDSADELADAMVDGALLGDECDIEAVYGFTGFEARPFGFGE